MVSDYNSFFVAHLTGHAHQRATSLDSVFITRFVRVKTTANTNSRAGDAKARTSHDLHALHNCCTTLLALVFTALFRTCTFGLKHLLKRAVAAITELHAVVDMATKPKIAAFDTLVLTAAYFTCVSTCFAAFTSTAGFAGGVTLCDSFCTSGFVGGVTLCDSSCVSGFVGGVTLRDSFGTPGFVGGVTSCEIVIYCEGGVRK